MSNLRHVPKLSIIALSLYSHLSGATELNLDFLQGVKNAPAILTSDTRFPQGQYFVDVTINKEQGQRAPLLIKAEEERNNMLCLSPQWLEQAGVLFKPEAYASVFDQQENCYRLAKDPHTSVQFDYGTQSLAFSIPQAYLLSKTDPRRWDYGVNGARVKYYGNFNKSSDNTLNAYGNVDLGINLGRWVLSSNMNLSYANNKTELTSSDLTLSTAISQVQGDLLLGKSQTRTELYSDFNFYGAALRSNSSMRSWNERGYAPDISGVANSTSRITVQQNGYTIYSKVVAPGPYQLNDLRPVGNGDLEVTVEDEAGHKTVTIYPVATLPTLLRPGEFQYNLALGKKNTSSQIDEAFSSGNGMFWLGSFDYGFATTTLNTAAILHNKYQSMGAGVTQSLGRWGAFSLSTIAAKAQYNDGTSKTGQSFNAKYAKSFTERTDLQLLTYRYQTRGYVEFADFNPGDTYFSSYGFGNQKSRYEARLSHRFDSSYISGSYWRQNYWMGDGYDAGATVALSTYVLGDVSIFINGSYTKRAYSNTADYSTSLGVSVPFNLGGIRHYSSSSVGYNRYGGTSFNTGVSATLNDRFNYSVNANTSSGGTTGASASASYAFDAIQTNVGVSQSDDRTSVSGSFSGSVIGTPETGLLFTKDASKTVAIISAPGMEGVTFNNSLPTNAKGNTAIWLNEYSENTISINMDNVPDDVEIENTSYNVVPTEGAMIYRKFAFKNVLRYILQVKDRQGQLISGASATTDNGLSAGFIANNGVLLVNVLAEPKSISVEQGNGKQCHFSMKGIKANTNTVQEVVCE
ncbi:PefC/AfrB family outer membrane usher protein [Edwardsiella tarda]|uniref:PefC/AfrB family outer membrane usher protein n=1 Tax=Edwardsiella tarda TaxID=636 RepID=UPI002852BE66|nr:PefC/AfrB family outer membrane usher protein [Edwardsiella tarda]UCQ27281.1 PefC/AfrB family outer membrane usher protein [Edwardsiella tarda]